MDPINITPSKLENSELNTTGSFSSTHLEEKKWSPPRCCSFYTIVMAVAMFILLVGFVAVLVLHYTVDTARCKPLPAREATESSHTNDTKIGSLRTTRSDHLTATDSDDIKGISATDAKTGRIDMARSESVADSDETEGSNPTSTETDSFEIGLRGGNDDCVVNGPRWYTADPQECNRFYGCYNGTVTHRRCRPGYVYRDDAGQQGCYYPWLVDCGDRSYNPEEDAVRMIRLNITLRHYKQSSEKIYPLIVPKMPLLYIMIMINGTTIKNNAFNFTERSNPFWGAYVTSINGIYQNWVPGGGEWWSILRAPNHMLPVGVSSFIPNDEDNIIFHFINSTGHD